jgi:hypothetical protein
LYREPRTLKTPRKLFIVKEFHWWYLFCLADVGLGSKLQMTTKPSTVCLVFLVDIEFLTEDFMK